MSTPPQVVSLSLPGPRLPADPPVLRLWDAGDGRGLLACGSGGAGEPVSGRVVPEPAGLDGPGWAGWAAERCREMRVDVLRPGARWADAAARARLFTDHGTVLLVPQPAAAGRVASLLRLFHSADTMRIPTPARRPAACRMTARDAVEAMRRAGHDALLAVPDTGGAAVLLGDPARQDAWAAQLPYLPGPTWLLCAAVPGSETAVDVLSGSGRVHAVGSRDGDGCPVRARASSEIVRALGLGPLTTVRWARSPDGRDVLWGVDPCPSGSLAASSRSLGLDLVWAAAREAVGARTGLGDVGPPLVR